MKLIHTALLDIPLSEYDFLHAGVLGMRWGIRKNKGNSESTDLKYNPNKRKKGKTYKNMSDNDLMMEVKRLNLEKQYASLTTKSKSPTRKAVEKLLTDFATKKITEFAKDKLDTKIKTSGSSKNKEAWEKVKETDFKDIVEKAKQSVNKNKDDIWDIWEEGGDALPSIYRENLYK